MATIENDNNGSTIETMANDIAVSLGLTKIFIDGAPTSVSDGSEPTGFNPGGGGSVL